MAEHAGEHFQATTFSAEESAFCDTFNPAAHPRLAYERVPNLSS